MKVVTIILSLLMIVALAVGAETDDQKKVKAKRFSTKTIEKKAGLGVLVTNHFDKEADQPADGARILEVFEDSEADQIGLKKGDVIIKINDKRVRHVLDLADEIRDINEGTEVQLLVLRDGQELSFKAILKPFKGNTYTLRTGIYDEDFLAEAMVIPGPEQNFKFFRRGDISSGRKGGYLGVQVKKLSNQLKTYFEVQEGVLIEEVMKESPAEKAGLKAGDVITAINKRKITDPEDLVRTINYFNPQEEVEIFFTRKGSDQTAAVVLGKKPAYLWLEKPGSPHSLHWIDEDDAEHLYIKKGKNKELIHIEEDDDQLDVKVEKQFFIL